MREQWTRWVLVLAILAGVVWFGLRRTELARADRDEAAAPAPRYAVIETEGHNLIVTDNQSNTLYFYTIDQGQKIGSELKLRGTVDLKQVGKATIKIKNTKPEVAD